MVESYSNPDKAIIRIELLASDGSLEVIEATANHPFYVEGQGWTRVDELDTNDFVPGSAGELLRIVALESTDRVETVFNFGVEEFHSYFVGELGAWVHNCLSPNKIRKSKLPSSSHPVDRAIERAGFQTPQEARSALRELNSLVTKQEYKGYYYTDSQYTDRIYFHLTDNSVVSYQVRPNGTAEAKTVLNILDNNLPGRADRFTRHLIE